MLNRDDMLELTRRMTLKRANISRIAGCYFDEEGYDEGSFNINFLKLSMPDRDKNLKLAKTVPFGETNKNLIELDFPCESKESEVMMRLLDGIKEVNLKNDALLQTFYEIAGEKLANGKKFAIFIFNGTYDIPLKGSDKEEQWESEEVYNYLICIAAPVYDDSEVGEAECGFLYPSFKDRSTDWDHIAVYEKIPGKSAEGLITALGCKRR
ncbi:DUF4317 family protein (plasmid) [Lachnospiraceae bacterium C1.1]|nr:DUF4317 family protein [Lachnospiraceae bacterium C1.1]